MTRLFAAFLARRIAAGVVFVLLVSSSALVLARLMPGDATTELVLAGVDRETIDAAQTRLGVDRPASSQLVGWLAGIARLDLGRSSRFNQPVAGLVGSRAGRTAGLAALALIVATLAGIPAGILSGAYPGRWFSRAVALSSTVLLSCPPIVAVFGLLLVAANTGWLPLSPGSYAVPVLALALPIAAGLERLQSQAVADAMAAPDLSAAVARGVPRGRLVWVHAARQSLRPVLGVYGIVIGGLFSGSLAVEVVTSWPGLGRLTCDALVARDLYLLAGCALAGAACIAIGSVVADVLRALADPRVRDA